MNQVIEADYKVVNERTLEVIVAEIQTIEAQVYEAAVTGAVKIGIRLQEIKETVGHGNWYDWIEEHLGYSKRQAQRFMEIAEKYGDENSEYFKAISNATTSSHLSISKALALLKVPENEVEEFVENNDISDMKVKELEDTIKKLKEEKEEAENKVESVSEMSANETRRMAEEIGELKRALEKAEQEKLDAEAQGSTSEEAQKDIEEKQAEIEKLQKKLEKAKKDIEKAKSEKEAIESKHKSEIDGITEKVKAEAMEEALKTAKESVSDKLKEAQDAVAEAIKRAETAEKNLEIAGSEVQMKRKINMNLIGTLAGEIKEAIDSEEAPDKRSEMLAKTRAFISAIADIFKEGN